MAAAKTYVLGLRTERLGEKELYDTSDEVGMEKTCTLKCPFEQGFISPRHILTAQHSSHDRQVFRMLSTKRNESKVDEYLGIAYSVRLPPVHLE